ncbi:hypothetical protein LIPSTDRAFT_71093, partial [Lipomyces starkeyi NRRL Y-11557]
LRQLTDNCEQTFTDTSSASTIPGTSTSPPAIAPTSQLTFDALDASIGTTNEGSMPNNTIGSLIAPPQLPAVGGDLALQNEIFLHNTQMEAVRQKYALRPKGTSQAYGPIQRCFTGSKHDIGLTASLDANCFSRNGAMNASLSMIFEMSDMDL